MARIQIQGEKLGGAIAVLAAVAILFVSGCSEGGPSASWLKNGLLDPTQVGDYEIQLSSGIRANMSLLDPPSGIEDAEQPSPEDLMPVYVTPPIGPGDFLQVAIYELQQFGATTTVPVRVDNSGCIVLPVLGRLPVAGYTAVQLQDKLRELLRERQIIANADVQVDLQASQALQVALTGPGVAKSGLYVLPRPDYRLHELIASAGGISPTIDKIYVFRRITPPGGSISALDRQLQGAEPASRPADELEGGAMARLMMSDTSSTRTSSISDPPPAASEPEIDELSILEGHATSKAAVPTPVSKPAAVPVWDSERGEWVIEGADEPEPVSTPILKQPASPAADEGESLPAAERRVDTPIPGSQPVEDEAESSPWDIEGELVPAVRIIEIPRQALMNGDPSVNIVLRPYDVVQIPAGDIGEYYLGGNIARPGAYSLTGRRLTVKQAIISAGGFNALAWPSRAQLIRKISPNEEQSIQLDLDAIFAMKAPDFYIKPDDIIQVGTTPLAPFLAVLRNAFRFSYGFGFVYDRNFADQDTATAEIQRKNYEAQMRSLRGLPP